MNPRPPECKSFWLDETALRPSSYKADKLLEQFREFLFVDLRRSRKTTYEAVRIVGNFLDSLDNSGVSREIVRQYLKQIKSESVYRNTLAAFKRFFRDFLDRPEIVATFKFPQSQFKPTVVPSKEELQRFYDALDSKLSKTLFLFYASSGLRKNEFLSLTLKNVDFAKRLIIPNCIGDQPRVATLVSIMKIQKMH